MDTGTILKLSPLGEHGLIITWCTEQHGILRTAARNARKPGSDLFGCIDLFYEGELLASPPKSGDLYTLKSAVLIKPRLALRKELLRLRLASYMARLMLATVEQITHDPDWHQLISGALDYLNESRPRLAILTHFEQRLAALHGIYDPAQSAHNCLLRHFLHLPSGRAQLPQAMR